MTVAEDILRMVGEKPGQPERQIAEALFGEKATIQRVNPTCRKLVTKGLLERRGKGYGRDPFTYHRRQPRR